MLKELLEKNAKEAFNMLMMEWNLDDALSVRYEEGIEQGTIEVARNALAKGLPLDTIHEITGLDLLAIQNIQASICH